MVEVAEQTKTLWKAFKTESGGDQRYFYTSEDSIISLKNKDYFNHNTNEVLIFRGYETAESSTEPISEEIFYIQIFMRLANYFGDSSETYLKSKKYVLVGKTLYRQLAYGTGRETTKFTKELNGILNELQEILKSERELQ